MEKPYVVGITGGSGSGKTFFLEGLRQAFGPEALCMLSQDHYYKPLALQRKDAQGIHNFDLPESIDFDAFSRDLESLKAGHKLEKQEYTFNNPRKKAKTLSFYPAPVLVVEGIFVFYHPELRQQLDLKVFIDAQEHIKLKRRIHRDARERGYELEDVLYRYEKHVAPTYTKYIEPFKADADLIIPNNQGCGKALAVLISFLRSKI